MRFFSILCGESHSLSVQCRRVARGGAVRGGRPPNPPNATTKKRERERKKEENKHFQRSKITYKFVLYEENTGHMHQIAPINNIKMQNALTVVGGTPPPTPLPPPPPPPPLARYARSGSVASLPRTLFLPPPPP